MNVIYKGIEHNEGKNVFSIDDCLESIYGSKEDKITATSNILILCKNSRNLEVIVQHHPIMSAMSRVLSDESDCSIHLTFRLGQIFLAISNFEELHSFLSNYRVGSLILSMVYLEVERKEDYGYDTFMYKNEREHYQVNQNIMMYRHDNILFVYLSVLIRFSDTLVIVRKMLKKGLTSILLNSLHRESQLCIQTVVILLKRVSIFEEVVYEIADHSKAINVIISFLFTSEQNIVKSSIRLLFNLSYNDRCRKQMVQSNALCPLVLLLQNSLTRTNSLRLIYHISAEKENRKCLWTSGQVVAAIMQLILNSPIKCIAKELGALAINASLEPLCAEEMVGSIEKVMLRVAKYEDILLAKVVRNLSIWTRNIQVIIEQTLMSKDIIHLSKHTKNPSKFVSYILTNPQDKFNNDNAKSKWSSKYDSCQIWNNHMDQIIKICTISNKEDLVLEMVGTLNQMTCNDMPRHMNWKSLIIEHSITILIQKWAVLGINKKDLIMEAVILCKHVCICNDCAELISTSGIISALLQILDHDEDDEILLQVLITCQTFIMFEKTRKTLLLESDTIQFMFEYFSDNNQLLYYASERFLDLILIYDNNEYGKLGRFAKMVRDLRYHTYNKTWLNACVNPN